MALIAMACHDTEENGRSELTMKTIDSLCATVDFDKHRLIIVDNNSCWKTKWMLVSAGIWANIITLQENIGTARAINKAWALRRPGEHCIKMDNDVVINHAGWVDEMEAAINRDPLIGQVGLKRKDCWEWPGHESEDYKSTLQMLPHAPGEAWIVVEKVKHVIGTCVMHSAALLDKVGYLFQFGKYGYDDVIMSHRAHLAGFYSCFLPHINIDHIDPGQTEYQSWKEKHSGQYTQQVIELVRAMYNGTKPIYYNE